MIVTCMWVFLLGTAALKEQQGHDGAPGQHAEGGASSTIGAVHFVSPLLSSRRVDECSGIQGSTDQAFKLRNSDVITL